MNELKNLEAKFKKGVIKKSDYIDKMYDIHKILWDYFAFIKDRNIEQIEISGEQILFTTKDGIKIICDARDERAIPLEILNFKDYETNELKTIRKFLKKDSVILDIGANIGWYCLSLSKNVPNGKIFAFEPIPETYKYLKENIALNNLSNIYAFNYGIGDENKEVLFYHNPNMTGATSQKNLHEDKKQTKVKAKIKILDDFISKLTEKVDFIKCDIEGSEIFAVKGGLETIKKTLPVIFLEMLRKWSAEYGYHPNDIILILKEIGYECFFVKNGKLVKIKKVSENTVATNFFFLHKKHNHLL